MVEIVPLVCYSIGGRILGEKRTCITNQKTFILDNKFDYRTVNGLEQNRVPFRALWLWEVYVLLAFLLLLFLIYFLLVPFTWLWTLLVALFTLIYLLAALLYFPLYYYGMRYSVDNDRILFESGVFARHRRVMLRDKLITVILIKTPLERLLHLANLRCNGPGATLMLWNLPSETARELQSDLMKRSPLSKQECEL